jgi:formate dehydrogenase iron-sulfur subunit
VGENEPALLRYSHHEAELIVPTTAFFTDSTLCIGCKACEVACKEWNEVPADGFLFTGSSYDNTGALGASTWRHVKFVEESPCVGEGGVSPVLASWQFSSDVCRHCEVAGCLEACPTGAIVRTELGGVFIQPDICNGCGYCVVGCPFGVVDRRPDDGRAFKCTFCYDRQLAGMRPACATACPTGSIAFGELSEMRHLAEARVTELHARGMTDAVVWDPLDSSVGGVHALFLVRGDARAFNLPSAPEVPTVYQPRAWRSAGFAAAGLLAATVLAFFGGRRS